MDVELQVFAGRPNPRFQLAPPAIRELARLLSQLRQAGWRRPPTLGYQGFVVYGSGPAGTIWPYVQVFRGTVTLLAGPSAGVYRDTSGIEAWLLAQADEAGMSALLDQVLPGRMRDGDPAGE